MPPSGIGRARALALARDGFRVFGAVRKQSDAEDLKQAPNGAIQTLILDVLDPDSIRAAVEVLKRELRAWGLDGLVNNAGIAVSAPLEVIPLAMFDDQMRVNVKVNWPSPRPRVSPRRHAGITTHPC